MRKSPGFTTVAVLTLALGIGANTAVFTVVRGVLLRALPFPDSDRLFLISASPAHGPFESEPSLSDREYLSFRAQDRLFQSIASFTAISTSLAGAGDPVQIPAASVTPDFFATLRVAPIIGRSFASGEDEKGRNAVAILSNRLWVERFGADPHVLAETIRLDGVERTVIGIMPERFAFPYEAEVWTPLKIEIDPHNSFSRPVVGRLKPGVSWLEAQAELETFARQWPPPPGGKTSDRSVHVMPLKELLVGNIRESLLVFAGAVGFVLLIACANVANLCLARASGRIQGLAVRSSLGASRWRLVQQVLAESTVVSFLGAGAGLLLALWGVPALIALAPAGKIPRTELVHIDVPVLLFTFGVAVMVGIAAGLVPALHVTRCDGQELLSRNERTTTGRHRGAQRTLATSEIALAMILLTGAGLMLKSYLRLQSVNPGFHAENTLTMTVDLPDSTYRTASQFHAFHTRVLIELSRLPGVLVAGAVNWRPLGDALARGTFQVEDGGPLAARFMVDKPCVSPGYFKAMGIRLLAGRDFSEHDDEKAPSVAMVSESVARSLWPGPDAIGKRISIEDHPKPEDWRTIIGVVDDVHQLGLNKEADSAIYLPYLQVTRPGFLSHMTFVLKTASRPQALAPEMRSVVRRVDKDQPVRSIAYMDSIITATTAEPRFQARLLAIFAGVALALAAVGIYGVLAYAVTQRIHEIGIRLTLGAQRVDLFGMLLRDALVMACAGVISGTAGALAVTQVLRNFLFEVQPTDPLTIMGVVVTVLCATLAAGTIPARRAMNVDPMVALRYE